MATTSGSQDLDVNRTFLGKLLREHPGRFDFFQMVRLLERMQPGSVPVGLWGPPGLEAMRFCAHNSLAFPASQVDSLDWPGHGQPRVTVNFMGLTGPNGVLPYSYTELVRDRVREKDRTLEEFFDLFNHRMISLFYQAWEKYRFFVGYERDRQDRFSGYLMGFVGLGTPGLQDRSSEVPDETFLYYSGLLSLQPRSAAALEQVLADYFAIPVEIDQFVGSWYPISTADQCSLDTGLEYSEQLGIGAVAGDEIWDLQSRVRIKLGPLTLKQYLEFLPAGRAYQPLLTLLRYFSGNEFEFEVQLVLKRNEVPRLGMDAGADTDTDAAPMLGWTTWMKSGPFFGRDPGDTLLMLN